MRRRSSAQAEGVVDGLSSFQASAMAGEREDPSTCTVQPDAATLACMLAAVHTSHQLHLLSSVVAQQYHAAAAAETRDIQILAGRAEETTLRQLAEEGSCKSASDLGVQALAAPATAELAAARSWASEGGEQPVSTAPTGTDATAIPSLYKVQRASLPAATEIQQCEAQGSLGVLVAIDQKIADSLKSTEVSLFFCSKYHI